MREKIPLKREWKKELTDASKTSFKRNHFIDFSSNSFEYFRLKLKLLPIACTQMDQIERLTGKMLNGEKCIKKREM